MLTLNSGLCEAEDLSWGEVAVDNCLLNGAD